MSNRFKIVRFRQRDLFEFACCETTCAHYPECLNSYILTPLDHFKPHCSITLHGNDVSIKCRDYRHIQI